MLVMPCAICVRGEVKSRTYMMKDMITPNLIVPFIASTEPMTHTATYATLPITFISGCIRPERNCDFQFASYTARFMPSKRSLTPFPAREMRTTSWPEYISSM